MGKIREERQVIRERENKGGKERKKGEREGRRAGYNE